MFFKSAVVSSLLATSAIAFNPVEKRQATNSTGAPSAIANDEAVIARLFTAGTAVDRLGLITDPADFVYHFQNPPAGTVTRGRGGMTVKADRKAFPPLIGNGVSMTVGFLGPCGFNTPHVHPRSAEINIIVEGSLGTQFQLENGLHPINNTLNQYDMTVFPQGAIHTEFNNDCTNAVFVAAFASEDPGVQQTAQTFFGLRDDVIGGVLGDANVSIDGRDLDTYRSLIPANVALGVQSCLDKCGLQRNAKREFKQM